MAASPNMQLVAEFCAAWSKLDATLFGDYLAEDVFYHNIPDPPLLGRAAAVAYCAGFFSVVKTVDFEMIHIAENGNVVLTERMDRFVMKNGKTLDLPVMGTFEIVDGKIAKWRDYYDGRAAAGLMD